MPHGAGHAGGHHHHGGGGFHHHHHHHHRGFHHHHYGATYGFGPHYRYGYRRRSLGWGFAGLAIFGVCVTLAVIFSVRYGLPDDNSSSGDFSPNETRALSISNVFCDSITLSVFLNIVTESGELSVLSKQPSLTDHDTFQFRKNPVVFNSDKNYRNWNYYLYEGSTISFSACRVTSQSSFTFYIIKGTGNFNNWVDDPYSGHAKKSGSVSAPCSDSGSRTNYTFNVQNEGEYYVVFLLQSQTLSGSLDVELDIYRTKYAVDPSSVISNCSLGSTGCSLDIPLSYSFVLVALDWDPYYNIDWTETVYIDSYCSARVWVYVVISLGCAGVFALIIAAIIVCCCCLVRRNKKKYTPLRGDNNPAPLVTEGPAPTTATYVTGTAPPPFNPSYGAPPQYSN